MADRELTINLALARAGLQKDAVTAARTIQTALGQIEAPVNLGSESARREAEAVAAFLEGRFDEIPVGFSVDAGGKLRNELGQFINVTRAQVEAGLQGLELDLEIDARGADLAKRAIAALGQEAIDAAKEAKFLQESLGLNPSEVEAVRRKMAELDEATAKTVRSFSDLSDESKAALTGIAGGAAAAIGAFAATGANAFLEFEQSAKTFEVLARGAGASSEEIAAVSEEARRLGATTSRTAGEVSALSVQLARAGFDAQGTEAALAGIVQGSIAAETNLASFGEIVGDTLGQFRLGGEEAIRVSDVLVAVSNQAKLNVEDLGGALKNAGVSAQQNAQSLETTTAALALLAESGERGERAGTSLSALFRSLSRGSAELAGGIDNQATRALSQLGVKIRDETTGEMRDLLDLIPELQAGLANLTPEQRDIALANIFDEEGLRAIRPLLAATGEDIERFRGIAEGAAGTSAQVGEALTAGLSGSLEQFSSAFEGLSSDFFGQFAAGAEGLVRGATGLIEAFQALPGPVKATVFATTGLVGVLSAAVGVISAYNLANGAKVVGELKSAAALLTSTVATKGKAAANALLSASELASAVATGKATAAQLAQVGALKAAAGAGLAFAGAAAAIALVADTYQSVTGEANATREATEGVRAALDEVRQAGGSGPLIPSADAAAENLSAVTSELNLVQRGFDFLIRGPIPGLATAAEAAANNSRIAFSELTAVIGEVEEEAVNLAFQIREGATLSPQDVGPTIAAIESSIDALQAQNPVTEEDIRLRDEQVSRLEEYRAILSQSTGATEELTDATEALSGAVKRIRDSLGTALEGLDGAALERRAQIEEALAGGLIAQEDADAQLAAAERENLQARIEEARAAVQELVALKAATTDPTELEELNAAILQAENTLNQDRINLARSQTQQQEREAQAQRQAQEEAIDAVVEANERAAAAIEASQTQRITALREQELAGVLTAQQAEEQIQQIRAEGTQQAIAARQEELASYQALLDQGQISQEDFEDKRRELTQETADLNLQLIEQELEARRAAEAEAQRVAEEGIQLRIDARQQEADLLEAQGSLEQSLGALSEQRLRALQVAAAARGDETTAAQVGVQIQQQQAALAEREAQQRRRAVEIQTEQNRLQAELAILQARGNDASPAVIASLERQAELTEEVGRLQLAQVDAETAMAAELRLVEAAQQRITDALQNRVNLAQREAEVYSAQTSLQQAQATLDQERLRTQIAAANARGDETEAARLGEELARQTAEAEELGFQAKLRALELQTQQNRLEAELAIIRARASGASEEEIANLQAQLSVIDEIANLQRQQIDAEAATARERRVQARIEGGASESEARAEVEGERAAAERQAPPRPLAPRGGVPRDAIAQLRQVGGGVAPPPSGVAPGLSSAQGREVTPSTAVADQLGQLNQNLAAIAQQPRQISITSESPWRDLSRTLETVAGANTRGINP